MHSQVTLQQINKLAIPAIIAGITEPVISITDTAIVGQLGSVPLAAVGLGASFFSFMLWVLGAFRHAISSIVSTRLGKNKLEEIATLLPQVIILNFLLGLVLLFLTGNFAREIFSLYEAKGLMLEKTVDYFQIRTLGFPLVFSVFVIFGIFRGFQNTIWAMYISFAGAILNIALDFILVYGIDGFIPSFGIKGAAYASVASQGFMLLLAIIFILKKIKHHFAFDWKLNPYTQKLIGMGGNLIVRTIALNLTFYFANRFATMYGTSYIACHTIFMNIWLFAAFFIDGYSNAANAIGGKLYGAHQYKELYKLGIKVFKIALVIAGLISLVYLAGYQFLPSFFTQDTAVITLFYQVFWIIILSQPINAIAFMLDGLYKGMGLTSLLRNSQLIATFIGFIPAVYLFDYLGLGLYGIWTAFFIWMLLRIAVLGSHFFTKIKKH